MDIKSNIRKKKDPKAKRTDALSKDSSVRLYTPKGYERKKQDKRVVKNHFIAVIEPHTHTHTYMRLFICKCIIIPDQCCHTMKKSARHQNKN